MKPATWLSCALAGLAVGLPTAANEHAMLNAGALNQGGSQWQYDEPQYLSGTIYAGDPRDQQVLFKFSRQASRFGPTLQVEHEFTYPDGKLAARERVVYQAGTLLSYAVEELQTGATGRAILRHSPEDPAKGSIEFTYTRKAGGGPSTRTEDLAENTLVNDMVGPFLLSHWKALSRGDKLKCRFIVVPRRETVGFTFVKDSEATWAGREAVVIRMEASSPLVATLVAPLYFTLEKAAPHRLLQYTGRTTPKVQRGGKWKDLDAVTVFDWNTARWATAFPRRD